MWVSQAVARWASEVVPRWDDSDRITDLRLDYLVTRLRRGTQQVGRARISFTAQKPQFRVWEATLRKIVDSSQGMAEGGQWAAPVGLRVDVQHFEPRSSRYRAVRYGGRMEPIAASGTYPDSRGKSAAGLDAPAEKQATDKNRVDLVAIGDAAAAKSSGEEATLSARSPGDTTDTHGS